MTVRTLALEPDSSARDTNVLLSSDLSPLSLASEQILYSIEEVGYLAALGVAHR